MEAAIMDLLQTRFGSANWNQFQIIRQPQYDFVRYPAAGTTQLNFFSVPVGGTDPNSSTVKTLEQTNLYKSASIGQNWFICTQVRCDARFLAKSRQPAAISGDTDAIWSGFCPDTTANGNAQVQMNNLLGRGVLNINLAQKNYVNIGNPFIMAPPGYGIDITRFGAFKPATNNAIFQSFWVQPNNDVRNTWQSTPILMIEPELLLNVSITFPDGTSPVFTNTYYVNDTPTTSTPNVEVGIVLDGYLVRPQQ